MSKKKIPMSKNKTKTLDSPVFRHSKKNHSQIDNTKRIYIPFKNIKQKDPLIF